MSRSYLPVLSVSVDADVHVGERGAVARGTEPRLRRERSPVPNCRESGRETSCVRLRHDGRGPLLQQTTKRWSLSFYCCRPIVLSSTDSFCVRAAVSCLPVYVHVCENL